MRNLVLLALLVGCPAEVPDETDTGITDPVDADSDGYSAEDDCDDDNADVNPGADEICNEIDDNCDGIVDEDALDKQTVYVDADGDSYGDPATETQVCEPDDVHVDNGDDCDDKAEAINPGAQEICDDNNVDEDCDGKADDADDSVSSRTFTQFYADSDGDGYGDPETSRMSCDAGGGWVLDNTDCDDKDAQANPALGCPGRWDGRWTGKVRFDVSVPDFGISDYCAGEGILIIEEGAREELTTPGGVPWECSGVEAEGTIGFSGSFSDADTIEGEFDLDGETFAFTAELSEDEGLVAEGRETRTIEGTRVVVDHDLSASPE